jgi:glutathione S-transferase
MLTIYGEGRGFRVVWLCEEMGLPYRLVDIDLLKGVEHYPDFLALNPAGFIPAITDGGVTMVESIAILQYLMASHGPTPLAPDPGDADYPAYLQFLMMGEAAISTSMFYYTNYHRTVPEAERSAEWVAFMKYQYDSRVDLIRRQLEQTPYLAGDRFTAADISTAYALENARRGAGVQHQGAVADYIGRIVAREGYRRTMDACAATKGWEKMIASGR